MSEQSSATSVDMFAEEVCSRGLVDERLRLIFACCHPQLDRNAQVAISLSTLGRLTTEEIADTFLVPTAAIAQRIVHAKRKSKTANNPFVQLPLNGSARGPRQYLHAVP